MNHLFAGFMVVHGAAHLVGFLGPWRLADTERVTWDGGLLWGRIPASESVMRGMGLVWLALALAFFAMAAAAALDRPGWVTGAAAVAVVSLVACALGAPASRIGIAVDAALLAALYAGAQLGWV